MEDSTRIRYDSDDFSVIDTEDVVPSSTGSIGNGSFKNLFPKRKRKAKKSSIIHEFFIVRDHRHICKLCIIDEENGNLNKRVAPFSTKETGSTGNLWAHIRDVPLTHVIFRIFS